jgi:hypothetical protein
MFEITGDDIARVSEEDLRTLVALLCEAELRRLGFSPSAVTWGGHQKAVDAGLDVRVALPTGTQIEGFVPRPVTGFQVKREKMPRSLILKEMKPRGILRQSIRELANNSGGYVIVSSQDSTSDPALQSRRLAMAEAVAGLTNATSLSLDFYDRTRLASWVRSHGGLILWVRARIGKAIRGWQTYGAWAYPPGGVKGVYLLDNAVRVNTVQQEDAGGMDALHAIQQIRRRLHSPRRVVRLVGLSGTGKTRLTQALFDHRIGNDAIDPSIAYYTNMADDPDPQPTGLVSNLVAERRRAVLVIDNCPSDLHRRLSEAARLPESTVSLLTIEYDIQDDEPEETDVFRLQPSSRELIEKLLKSRFSTLSATDAGTIAEFSGGNARVAIAVAGTVQKNETVARLKDEELFERLFYQKRQRDDSLLIAAEACSLVYSFNGEDVSSGTDVELVRLGAMVDKHANEMFRHVAELKRRDLVQQRGVWRAVLPQAIANRLATRALQNIPWPTIEQNLVYSAPARLLKSFSRRLGLLHTSKEAAEIIEKWLAPGGLLGNVTGLSDVGSAMFENVAPGLPDAAL